MSDLAAIGGYILLSPQLALEVEQIREVKRLWLIGPLHGPPLPSHIAMRRRLSGHPTGPIQR